MMRRPMVVVSENVYRLNFDRLVITVYSGFVYSVHLKAINTNFFYVLQKQYFYIKNFVMA